MEQVSCKASANPILITGDYNAAHQLSGYVYSNPLGNMLYKLIEDLKFSINMNPKGSNRLGMSTARDTDPGLTFTGIIPQASSTNLQGYHGSDHAVLATTIQGTDYKTTTATAKLKNWS
ncbi:hypothetical protein HPB48_000708 [Haemaphysalis longicornis]|uniref:Endonuclease/exonuclease/phosphatase domain-containing protein n=1 Tax=Haemaphysalis longicornis TaxID=44386 RepID=A0A9J6GVV3_HAELO|nr:hypothetical protein HPB48_000708 [Haemaphysalis longicornis]